MAGQRPRSGGTAATVVTRCSCTMARKASRSKRGSVTMRAPACSVALSMTEPKMWAIGISPATTSSGPRFVSGKEAKPRSVATAPAWVWAVLLGSPVVPLELMSSAIAPGSAASGSADRASPPAAPSASSASTPAAVVASAAVAMAPSSATTKRART